MELINEYLIMLLDIPWIIELFLLTISWVVLCGKAKTVRKWILHTLLLLVTFGLANLMVFVILGGLNYYFICIWGYVHGAVSAIYLWRHSPYHKKTWILLWVAMYNTILSTAALSGQCSALYGIYIQRGIAEGIVRCVIYCVMPLTALYLRRYKFDEFPTVPKSSLVLVGIMCVCIQILSLVEAHFFVAGDAIRFVLLFVYLCFVLTSIASIQAIYTMCSEQRDILSLQLERQRFMADHEINKVAESALEDLKLIRHDLKNQFSYCQILLEESRYDELKDYFAKLKEHMPVQLNLTDCGNKTMNTVLNMEFSKLRAQDIPFETQLVVPPVLPFRDEEICAVIMNLIDNALDECVRLKEKGREDVKIRIEIYPHQSYLYIQCSNSTDRKHITHQGRGLRSTKSDKSIHGYGTRIVSRLAEKYNGCADYSLQDGMFVARVMMDMVMGREEK